MWKSGMEVQEPRADWMGKLPGGPGRLDPQAAFTRTPLSTESCTLLETEQQKPPDSKCGSDSALRVAASRVTWGGHLSLLDYSESSSCWGSGGGIILNSM